MADSSFRKGLIYALTCFAVWGSLPLYWRVLSAIKPMHILAFRILLSLVTVGIILSVLKDFKWLIVFKDFKKGARQILTGLLLSANWGVYVWAVSKGHTIEASLGYYINPLISVVLGLIFFREKLNFLQWAAFGSACVGVLILTWFSGKVPGIALFLAVSFALYGVLKKTLKLEAMESLGAETLGAVPVALALLLFRLEYTGQGLPHILPNWQSLSYVTGLGAQVLIPLAFCGVISCIPLFLFAKGARLLPLSTLGFAQLISPTIQFLVGFLVFKEYFPFHNFVAYSFVWFGAILYIISLGKMLQKPEATGPADGAEGAASETHGSPPP